MRLAKNRICWLNIRRCGNIIITWVLVTLVIACVLYLKDVYVLGSPEFRKGSSQFIAVTTAPAPVCDKVAYNDSDRMLYFSFWPTFRGYDSTKATPSKDNPDPLLMDRILRSQSVMKTPLFRFRGQNGSVKARHEWKFEKIIHQTWVSEKIPGQTAAWVRKWLEQNPDWTYMFWTDVTARTFVERYFPSLLQPYDSWSMPVMRADMFRYIVLYAFGGVYADLDMEPLRPLDEIRNWSSCILSKEPDLQTFVMTDNLNCWGNNWTYTCNAFMACRSHHPFLHYVISRVVQYSPPVLRKPCTLKNLLECTGPTLVSLAHGFYKRSVPETLRLQRKDYDVICPDYEWFLPTFDNSRLSLVRKQCRSRRIKSKAKEACTRYRTQKFKNRPLKHSFTTHHWFHSYLTNVKKDMVDIRNVTKPYIWPNQQDEDDFEICFE